MTRFFTATVFLQRRRSPCAKYRVMFTLRSSPRARWLLLLGDGTAARELKNQAKSLRRRFEEIFWCEELSTYALALDGTKRPCRVRTSNAGHCLFAGIATEEHARRVASTLTDETSFSGWGIRTVASSEARYNPMSYHNGSIWPHDNSLIAAGFARYELKGVGCHGARWYDGREHLLRFTSASGTILRFSATSRRSRPHSIRWPAHRRRGLPALCFFCCEAVLGLRIVCAGKQGNLFEAIPAAVSSTSEHSRSESRRRER